MFKGLFFILALIIGVPAAMMAGWVILSNTSPGAVGTPAHAGAVSNGKPEECTSVEIKVRARSTAETTIAVTEGQILRGTYEANGGFGSVDILARAYTPNGVQIMESKKKANFDFLISVKMSGEYKFVFDNRYSMVTPKAIGLFYCIQK